MEKIQVLASICLTAIAIATIILYIKKKRASGRQHLSGLLSVEKAIFVGPKEKIFMVRWRGYEYLVSNTPVSSTLLDKQEITFQNTKFEEGNHA